MSWPDENLFQTLFPHKPNGKKTPNRVLGSHYDELVLYHWDARIAQKKKKQRKQRKENWEEKKQGAKRGQHMKTSCNFSNLYAIEKEGCTKAGLPAVLYLQPEALFPAGDVWISLPSVHENRILQNWYTCSIYQKLQF